MKNALPTTRQSRQILTRRNLLKTAPAVCASALFPRILSAADRIATQTPTPAAAPTQPVVAPKPFSTFTDVAPAAGLTATMFYGIPEAVTYIVEEMGGGCAFFDYDNDGWMDIFIVGGRRLEDIPPGASNRLYKNNRDGTFTDVTEKAGLLGCWLGRRRLRWRLQQRRL
jgi:hypothetical protein